MNGIFDASCAAFVEECDGVEGACYEARCQEEFATVDECESAGDDHLWCDGPTPAPVPVPTLPPTREPTFKPTTTTTTADPEPAACPEQPRRRLTDCVTYPCACQDHPGKCIVVGSMGEGGVRCSAGIRPHITEEFCNTVTDTEGGYCGGEKYPIAAGAFCKWTFCPAPADEGRRLDALPLLTAAVSKAMASVQLENATAAGLAELRRAVAKLEAAKANHTMLLSQVEGERAAQGAEAQREGELDAELQSEQRELDEQRFQLLREDEELQDAAVVELDGAHVRVHASLASVQEVLHETAASPRAPRSATAEASWEQM